MDLIASGHEWVEIGTERVFRFNGKNASFINRNFLFICCFLLKSLFGSTLNMVFAQHWKNLALVGLITCFFMYISNKMLMPQVSSC